MFSVLIYDIKEKKINFINLCFFLKLKKYVCKIVIRNMFSCIVKCYRWNFVVF